MSLAPIAPAALLAFADEAVAAPRAEITGRMTRATSARSLIAPSRRRRAASGSPWSSSMAMNGVPSAARLKSTTSTMLGCESRLVTSASRFMRPTATGSEASAAERNLIAKRRGRRRCAAS